MTEHTSHYPFGERKYPSRYKVTKMYGATRSVTHPKTVARFKDKVREITRRMRRVSIHVVIWKLNQLIRGWTHYYGRGLSQKLKRELNRWIIRRLKAYLWRSPEDNWLSYSTAMKRSGMANNGASRRQR